MFDHLMTKKVLLLFKLLEFPLFQLVSLSVVLQLYTSAKGLAPSSL